MKIALAIENFSTHAGGAERYAVDLAGMLVAEGWALARSDAPAEYHALQRIAESQELGIWGNKIFRLR